MLLIGSLEGVDSQIVPCTSYVEIQAIDAKVGEAARTSNPIRPPGRCVSEERVSVGLDIFISEFPIVVRQCFPRRLTCLNSMSE